MRIFCLAVAMAASCVWGQTPELVRGTVDGKPVNQAQLEALINLTPAEQRGQITGDPEELLRFYGFITRMAEMGEKARIFEQSPYKEQLELSRKMTMAIAEMAEHSKNLNITSADVEKYFKDHQDEFTTANVTVVQVPVKSQADAAAAKAKADTVWKQVQGGADFGALAKQYPVDGDFHSFKKSDALPKEIKDAVLALKPGAVTRPIERPNGFFLIRLDSLTLKTLQDARGDVLKTLQDQAYQEWLNGVRKSVVIGK